MSQEQQTQNSERDAAGRFVLGNKGGPGNPFARSVARIRKVLQSSVSEEQIARIGKNLADLAEKGNVEAAKVLFSYLIGKPEPAPDPDQLDFEEWKIMSQTVAMKDETAKVMGAGTTPMYLEMCRVMRPLVAEVIRAELLGQMKATNDRLNETPEDRKKREVAEAQRIMSSPAKPMPPELEARLRAASPQPAAQAAPYERPQREPLPKPSSNGRFHVET